MASGFQKLLSFEAKVDHWSEATHEATLKPHFEANFDRPYYLVLLPTKNLLKYSHQSGRSPKGLRMSSHVCLISCLVGVLHLILVATS